MRKLFLSLFVLAASAAYVAKVAVTEDGGVQTFLDRISFKPDRSSKPKDDPYGLFDGDSAGVGDAPAAGDSASASATAPARALSSADTDLAETDPPLPPLTFTPPYELGPPVPDDTPIAATRIPELTVTASGEASPAAEPAAATLPLPRPASASPATTIASGKYRDGAYTGSITDAYFGAVQVRANVSGGHVVGVDILKYPSDRRTSRSINSYALPLLQREVVLAQAADVNIVSGATLTAVAYVQSLRAALKQAQ